MPKRVTLNGAEEISALEAQLHVSAERTRVAVMDTVSREKPLASLYRMKFESLGCDPLDADRALNLVEQLHQTFTYLASLRAAAILFARHPGCGPLNLNLGTAAGWDIESSVPGLIAAEVFTAVTPDKNRKLSKDVARMAAVVAEHRYVFFMSPGFPVGPHCDAGLTGGVQVWSLGCDL